MIAALADGVLVLHVAFVLFVVGLPLFVMAGAARGWRFTTNLPLRVVHLTTIAIVIGESWSGVPCPLTTLETWLRARAGARTYDGGFIEHGLQSLLFHEAPPWVFVAAYSLFGVFVLATWWFFPPRPTWRPTRRDAGIAAR